MPTHQHLETGRLFKARGLLLIASDVCCFDLLYTLLCIFHRSSMDACVGRSVYRRLLSAARALPSPDMRRITEKIIRRRVRLHAFPAERNPSLELRQWQIAACTARFLDSAARFPGFERLMLKQLVVHKFVSANSLHLHVHLALWLADVPFWANSMRERAGVAASVCAPERPHRSESRAAAPVL